MNLPQPPSERGIPLLTEVLAPAAELSPQSQPRSPQPSVIDNAPPSGAAQWPAAPEADVDEETRWRQLSQDIQEQVLQQLLGQVNSLLKQQIAEQMATAFEHITQQLTAQIQVNLEQALQQSVLLAVEQEIEKTRMTKNKDF